MVKNAKKTIPKLDPLAELHCCDGSIGWLLRMDLHSTWQLLHHRAFDEVTARAVQSATLRLLTLWSAGSTPRLIVALPFARDWTLRWGLVRDRCESVGVGIQRRCVERMFACDFLWLSVFLSRTCAKHSHMLLPLSCRPLCLSFLMA